MEQVKDWSVYLVTDSKLNHPKRKLKETVEDAIKGGVSIVQLREKELDTIEFIRVAEEIHLITKKYNVPLIINDNVEVAKAIDAEGLHIGQDDLPLRQARQILGPKKIIGVSVENKNEALKAIDDGADYLGIQTCYVTQTKVTGKKRLGHIGVREILEAIPSTHPVKTVAIGGINASNIPRLVGLSSGYNNRELDGIAVVSAIMSSDNATDEAKRLKEYVEAGRVRRLEILASETICMQKLPSEISDLYKNLPKRSPLIYHLTNHVVLNDLANCCLGLGSSPIMSFAASEAQELASLSSSVLINIGTLDESFNENVLIAGREASILKKPIVFDPVGVGCTDFRKSTALEILNSIDVTIIKGNPGEICSISKLVGCEETVEIESKGVDSGTIDGQSAYTLVKALAYREGCIVVMTGENDYISNGKQVFIIENGHSSLQQVTGSGCMVGSAIASFLGISPLEPLKASIAGVLSITVGAERALRNPNVQGPGSLRTALIDELSKFRKDDTVIDEFRIREVFRKI